MEHLSEESGNIKHSSSSSFIAERDHVKGMHPTVLVFTHRNPFIKEGGIEFCIRRELDVAISLGYRYVLAFPSDSYRSAHSGYNNWLTTIEVSPHTEHRIKSTVHVNALYHSLPTRNTELVVIHSFLNHNILFLRTLFQYCRLESIPTVVFLHDFSFACGSPHLLPHSSAKHVFSLGSCDLLSTTAIECFYCDHNPSRIQLLSAKTSILELANHIISPSQYLLRSYLILADRFGISSSATISVLPHYQCHPTFSDTHSASLSPQVSKATIAFYGSPLSFKGWDEFHELSSHLVNNRHYRLVHFTSNPVPSQNIESFSFSSLAGDNYSRLISLAAQLSVKAFFTWNHVPESYGLSIHEAIASGIPIVGNLGNKGGHFEGIPESHSRYLRYQNLSELLLDLDNSLEFISHLERRRLPPLDLKLSSMSLSVVR